jgi:hypothetical protein
MCRKNLDRFQKLSRQVKVIFFGGRGGAQWSAFIKKAKQLTNKVVCQNIVFLHFDIILDILENITTKNPHILTFCYTAKKI